jgi:pimeloyl-ACP methyl ester carboxylesterase
MLLRTLYIALALTVGCSVAPSATPPAPTPADPPVGPPPSDADAGVTTDAPIAWKPCDVASFDGPARPAECAVVTMPASRGGAGSSAATFPVHVTRIRATVKGAKQLWLLNGGPGADGSSLSPYADAIVAARWGYDVYMPDHRGTGKSNPLSCKTDDLVACGGALRAQWGDALPGFSTTESARDVAELIRRTRSEGQKAFVLGLSYGSYWTHRLLQVDPAAADAVILDGICLGERCAVDRIGSNLNEGLRRVLEACKSDSFCAGKLSPDPMAKAQEVSARPSATCGSPQVRRDLMFALLVAQPSLLPALVARLDRCAASDQAAVAHLTATLTKKSSGDALASGPFGGVALDHAARWETGVAAYSRALGAHIRASEMVSVPRPSDADFRAANAALPIPYAGSSVYDRTGLTWIDTWPRYVEPLSRQWATLKRPMLLVNGRFDGQSPLANLEEALPHFDPKLVKSVAHPTAGHGVLFASDCGWSLLQGFLADPTGTLDTSCLADDAIDYSKDDQSKYWFGTANPWD